MEAREAREAAGGNAGGAEEPESASARVVLITAPPGEPALRLARGLVDAGLVACVNVVGDVVSVYRWQGSVEQDAESLCIAKTTVARLAEIERWLDEHHPYDVPECVALEPARVAPAYLAWLSAESEAR